MLFVKPSVWVGLATQTSLLSTTITMLAAPLVRSSAQESPRALASS